MLLIKTNKSVLENRLVSASFLILKADDGEILDLIWAEQCISNGPVFYGRTFNIVFFFSISACDFYWRRICLQNIYEQCDITSNMFLYLISPTTIHSDFLSEIKKFKLNPLKSVENSTSASLIPYFCSVLLLIYLSKQVIKPSVGVYNDK